MIEFEHVTKLYRTVIGVNDLSFQLKEGPFGLIGPNGSGKTTLINLLTGNLKPSLGKVRIAGHEPWRNRRVLGQLGLCPATDLLCPNVSAFEWVRYLVGLGGVSRIDAGRLAIDSLKRVGMEEAMHRPIGTYSLGMRQRTKLAQAIAHDPQWLILDEPFNGLDPVGRHELCSLIKSWGNEGRGMILASHVLHEVESVTNQFLLIHGGRILASGDAAEVQSMLVDFPQEIVVKGEGLFKLASAIAVESWVTSTRFSSDRTSITLGVKDAMALYHYLSSSSQEMGCNITGIEAPTGNLATAFDSLLRVHRGEIE